MQRIVDLEYILSCTLMLPQLSLNKMNEHYIVSYSVVLQSVALFLSIEGISSVQKATLVSLWLYIVDPGFSFDTSKINSVSNS